MAVASVAATARLAGRSISRTWAAKEVADGVQSYKKQIILFPVDGNWLEADPFLLLAEDWIRKPGGFEPHPHRGFETVSILFNGALRHTDYSRANKGATAVVRGLDVQWMRTGRGIVHSEMPEGDSDTHMLQLWVNLPSTLKFTTPGHQDIPAASIPAIDMGSGYQARVIAGTVNGVEGPSSTIHPVVILDITRGGLGGGIPGADTVEPAESAAGTAESAAGTAESAAGATESSRDTVPEPLRVPKAFNGFVYAAHGNWVFTSGKDSSDVQLLKHSHAAIMPPIEAGADVLASGATSEGGPEDSELRVQLKDSAASGRLFVFLGLPIGEPVVARGPFVMNTNEQVRQAMADYHAGTF
jgi:redox-sensitive bicupin YhaK (pirin superfamily)